MVVIVFYALSSTPADPAAANAKSAPEVLEQVTEPMTTMEVPERFTGGAVFAIVPDAQIKGYAFGRVSSKAARPLAKSTAYTLITDRAITGSNVENWVRSFMDGFESAASLRNAEIQQGIVEQTPPEPLDLWLAGSLEGYIYGRENPEKSSVAGLSGVKERFAPLDLPQNHKMRFYEGWCAGFDTAQRDVRRLTRRAAPMFQ